MPRRSPSSSRDAAEGLQEASGTAQSRAVIEEFHCPPVLVPSFALVVTDK